MSLKEIGRMVVKAKQKAIVAAVVAAAAFLAGRYPELEPVLTTDNVDRIGTVVVAIVGSGVSAAVGYAVTWWKSNK